MAKQSGEMENLVSLNSFSSFYKGKRVFITGHTGFKGAWLFAILRLLGASIKGYALAPEYSNSLYSLLCHNENEESVIANIQNKALLKKEILAFQPDIIFHLAAQPLVRRSYKIPSETFEINVVGTSNLLEAICDLPGKCTVVVVTTDKVYKNHENGNLYKEEDSLGGYDPYSASKACAELVVEAFRNSFFNPRKLDQHQKRVVSARAGNVMGGGDWSEDRIIPDMIRSFQANVAIGLRNPNSVRPWQHVLEPVCGYLLLAQKVSDFSGNYSDAYNFGPLPDDHLNVRELADLVTGIWPNAAWFDASSENQPHEAGLLKLDISKIQSELGWNPKLNVKEAVAWTIEWYMQPIEKQLDITNEQIVKYLNL